MHTTLTGPAWAQMLVEAGGKDLLMLTNNNGYSSLSAAAMEGHDGMGKVRQGTCTRTHAHTHTHPQMHTRTHTHTHTHAHTHTHTKPSRGLHVTLTHLLHHTREMSHTRRHMHTRT